MRKTIEGMTKVIKENKSVYLTTLICAIIAEILIAWYYPGGAPGMMLITAIIIVLIDSYWDYKNPPREPFLGPKFSKSQKKKRKEKRRKRR